MFPFNQCHRSNDSKTNVEEIADFDIHITESSNKYNRKLTRQDYTIGDYSYIFKVIKDSRVLVIKHNGGEEITKLVFDNEKEWMSFKKMIEDTKYIFSSKNINE